MQPVAKICRLGWWVRVLGRACRWKFRVQLSTRTFRWMHPLHVVIKTVAGDLLCSFLPESAGGYHSCRVWWRPWVKISATIVC